MDPFEEIQNTIQQILPIVLLVPGAVLTGSGLFIWLGGLRWLKAIAAFTAALAGMLGAWFFTERQLVPMVVLPVILAGIGIYFHKLIVVLIGAAIGALLVLFVPVLADIEWPAESSGYQTASEESMDLFESLDWIQTTIAEARQGLKDVIADIPESRKTAAIGAAVVIAILGIFSWRLVCAATCSVMGTTLILAGMVVLVLYKGKENFERMLEMRHTITLGVLGMVVGGVLIQLLLCPPKAKKITKEDIKKELLSGDKK